MDEWTVTATANGYVLSTPRHECPCLVGKAGLIAASRKYEGDMATPVGNWPLRRVYFRPDRLDPPDTTLPLVPIHENLGWCDDPANLAYNQAVELPFADSHETMWRDDSLYDIVVELGYNDAPPVAGLGSAIEHDLFGHYGNLPATHFFQHRGLARVRTCSGSIDDASTRRDFAHGLHRCSHIPANTHCLFSRSLIKEVFGP